ncbi:MAG: bifunctional alpha,alpha-trehalose-phosphate synthase (UDP-forming)/trehalose-phosphatase, partial [Chloroflexi bacterium]|nr:bifunctional alpha,alpha-trehalose-phosphate synthase (UDP-forming)/trehalose-phosphatase [Chloroflexota bacterium]
VTLRRGRDGAMDIVRSSGGLVAALGPIHEAGDGLWIGNVGDQLEPDVEKDLSRRRYVAVPVSNAETRGYYYGYSNSAVWPLFHYMPERAKFDRSQFETYRAVNQRFADQIVESYEPGDTIWVQDYQLMLVPRMVRERLPDARIGFFLHIPFPSSEMFRLLPERDEIVRGLLGANVIGFHTYDYARHFISAVLRTLGIHMREGIAQLDGHRAEVGTFPIGIDTEAWRKLAVSRAAENSIRELRSHFGERRIILGVERLDYTKGIPLKLQAFRRLLTEHRELLGKVVLIQVVVPSREAIASYDEQRREIEQMVGQINGEFGTPGVVPIHYQHRSTPPAELAALYRIADVALVTPLRDGMNLVAKEYIACQVDGDGTLVLSEFAGAASELGEALRVNPWDVDGTAETIYRALEMDPMERRERTAGMFKRIRANDVHRWARLAIAAIERPAPAQLHAPEARDPDELAALIKPELEKAKRPAILLDYDGTIREFTEQPHEARPTESILRVLKMIERHEKAQLILVSGRDSHTLDEWFSGLAMTLIAEHGAWTRFSGESEWAMAGPVIDQEWKRTVLAMLNEYTRRTPGSSVEEKTTALVWHYRAADKDLGRWQARELTSQLEDYLANEPVEVIEGALNVEVRQQGINKATAYRTVEQALGPFDFHLAMGDDTTDEDLFSAIPDSGFSIHVGGGPSRARESITSPSAARALLRALFNDRGPASD